MKFGKNIRSPFFVQPAEIARQNGRRQAVLRRFSALKSHFFPFSTNIYNYFCMYMQNRANFQFTRRRFSCRPCRRDGRAAQKRGEFAHFFAAFLGVGNGLFAFGVLLYRWIFARRRHVFPVRRTRRTARDAEPFPVPAFCCRDRAAAPPRWRFDFQQYYIVIFYTLYYTI